MTAGKDYGLQPGHTSSIRRIEGGMLSYHADADIYTNPFEVGLDRLVALDSKINFIGKKGVFNQCDIKDRRIVDMIKSLYKLTKKNENIFSYIDPDTKKKILIDENDVNEYLKQFGENITSKNFRTYNANMYYINIITNKEIPNTITARKKLSNDIIKQVSKELHHTSAICKKSYLNNDLIDTYINSPNKFNTYFIKNKNKNTNKNSNKYSNKNNFIRFLVANN